MDQPNEKQLSIGEVAKRSGLRTSALRYYEEIGLLPPPNRRSGRRYYDPSVLRRLAVIALCQGTGFTISEISELLNRGSGARAHWRRLAERKVEELDAQVEKTKATKRLLEQALACECGRLEGCQIVQTAQLQRVQIHRRVPRD
jgi:MerR family redox-sensitive transcriptional activator SoxR